MELNTRGRFAVMAIADLANFGEQGVVALTAISERQHLSLAYLEKLFAKLRSAGLVESTRGRDPIVVRLGRAEIAPGIERALIGMEVGEEKSIDLGPDDGYGPVRPEAIHRRRRDDLGFLDGQLLDHFRLRGGRGRRRLGCAGR